MSNEQQKGSGFVPIGELADTLPGVIPSGRGMSAQARHHFTTLRQVNRLIEVSEAEPDLGHCSRSARCRVGGPVRGVRPRAGPLRPARA